MTVAEDGNDLSSNVIKIEDARELRALGLPILPIVDASFSKRAERFFINAEGCRLAFYGAFVEHSRAPSRKRFRQMTQALTKLDRILTAVAAFASPQEGEAEALRAWFSVYVKTFVVFWNDVLTAEGYEPPIFNMTREVFDGWELPTTSSPFAPTAT